MPGALENRYYCDIPDELLFTNICTLDTLADIVIRGELSPEQKQLLEHAGEQNNVVVVEQKEPLCPWFVLCC